jgi:hypothetical protein
MAKLRGVPPCSDGPPNGPSGNLVSATRQGAVVTNCRAVWAYAPSAAALKKNDKKNVRKTRWVVLTWSLRSSAT